MQVQCPITSVNTIADRMKSAREAKGWSQGRLAQEAKVTQGTIGNIESGARKRPRDLLAIAAALGVDPGWLQSGQESRQESRVEGNSHNTLVHLPVEQTAEQTLTKLGELLRNVAPDRREAVAGLFSSWVREGGAAIYPQLIAPLLATPVHDADTQAQPDKRAA